MKMDWSFWKMVALVALFTFAILCITACGNGPDECTDGCGERVPPVKCSATNDPCPTFPN